MSCAARAVVVAERPEPLLDHVGRRLVDLEARWSRFRPESEISGLNAADGSPRRASSDTIGLVESLVQAWHVTDGAFDPTLLATLIELGYAASRVDATIRTSLAPHARPFGQPDRILVDRERHVVHLPSGTVLDPGGLGKGLAADLIVDELLELGAAGGLVEIGGDLRVAGHAPDGDGWPIEIRTAPDAAPAHVALSVGGVATSSSRLRRWPAGDEVRHHVIDPRTLRSTSIGVIGCTVVAGSAALAEAFTKVAFVHGHSEAIATYDRHGLAARIVTDDGATHCSDAWEQFERPVTVR